MLRFLLLGSLLLVIGCSKQNTSTVRLELYKPVSCLEVDCDLVKECDEQWCHIKVNCCCKDPSY